MPKKGGLDSLKRPVFCTDLARFNADAVSEETGGFDSVDFLTDLQGDYKANWSLRSTRATYMYFFAASKPTRFGISRSLFNLVSKFMQFGIGTAKARIACWIWFLFFRDDCSSSVLYKDDKNNRLSRINMLG